MSDLNAISQVQAVQGEKIEKIEASCEKIEQCLLGNGKPGLVVRTDRLEQKDKLKTGIFWIVASAVVALLVKVIAIDLIGALAQAAAIQ